MSNHSYRVGLLSYNIIGGLTLVFCLGFSIYTFIAKQYFLLAFFMFFVFLGAYMILGAGSFEISDDAVEYKNVFGHYRIFWKEILNIEFGTGGTIVFHGEGKRFIVSPPGFWSGKQKPEAFNLFKKKIDELGVISYPSNVADYKTNKNVRVH